MTAADLPAWPAVLSDCASVAKVDLPNFAAKAVPVTFGPLEAPANPLIVPTAAAKTTTTTDTTGLADWPFVTSSDPGDPTGEQQNQLDYMPVAVHRPELDRLRTALSNALFGSIPDLLRPFVDALFAPFLDGLQGRLNELLDAHGTGVAVLVFHDKAPPSPSPSLSASPASSSGCNPSPVPAGSYTGTYTATHTITTGSVDRYDEAGSVTLNVAGDGTISGTWGATIHWTHDVPGLDHLDSTGVLSDGPMTGTACNLIAGPPNETTISCTDSKLGNCLSTVSTGTFQTTGTSMPFGRPTPGAARGSFTWQVTNDDPSEGVTGFVRITVSGQ